MHFESRALSSNIASNHPQLPSSSSLSSSSSSSSLSASTSSLSPQRTEVRRTIWSHQVNLTQKIIKLMLQVQNLTAEGEQQGPFHLRLFLWWGFLCQCLLSACIHDTANHQNVAGSKSRSRGLTGGALPSSTVFVVRFFGVSRRCLFNLKVPFRQKSRKVLTDCYGREPEWGGWKCNLFTFEGNSFKVI